MAEQFIKLPKPLLARGDLILTDKIVLAYLTDKQGHNGHCWPGGRTIARELGVDKATIFRSLDRLAELGEITIIGGNKGQGNKYKVSAKCGQSQNAPVQNADSQVSAKCAGVSAKCGQKRPQNADISDRPNKRPSKKTQCATLDLPFELDTPAFRETWGSYIQHRKEKRSTLTPTAVARALKQCEAWGEARAIAAIEHSITMGWTGIFEDKGKAGKAHDEPETEEEFQARLKRVFDKAKKEKDHETE